MQIRIKETIFLNLHSQNFFSTIGMVEYFILQWNTVISYHPFFYEHYLMLNNGRKFNMEMSSKPIVWLDVKQEIFGCRTSQAILFHFLSEILLFLQKHVYIAKVVYSSRPVMRQKYIYRSRNLKRKKIITSTNIYIYHCSEIHINVSCNTIDLSLKKSLRKKTILLYYPTSYTRMKDFCVIL